ncbi:MAG: polyprenyl synthetase family protein [Candidatus Dojkabacteria bacterium]|nr:MAG: polyprenyl synthetase family protein [Candidatus Dojkabacteria bacterium]
MEPLDQKAYSMLKTLQPQVEDVLNTFLAKQIAEAEDKYTPHSKLSIEALHDISVRGGKRLRAAFVHYAYQMLAGTDTSHSLELAAIIELIHAYLLVEDDFMDVSATRRGGPTAHEIIKKYHVDARLKHDSTHFGNAIAVTAGIMGSHMAMQWLSELNVAPETRVALAQNLNRMLVVTSQGQINDVFNESLHQVTEKDVINVLLWKTSAYTYENPLHSGAILAGASLKELDTLSEYSYWGGIAFQIKDDILGTFGEVDETGKSNMDDIREGKMTLLSVKALEMANSAEQKSPSRGNRKSDTYRRYA